MDQQTPFDFSDLWRPSAFTIEQIASNSIFHAAETELPALQLRSESSLIKHETLFDLPELIAPGNRWPQELEELEGDASGSDTFSLPTAKTDDGKLDIWAFDAEATERDAVPRLRTWEAFEKKSVAASKRPYYVSEAGPGVFDAVLQEREKTKGVLPQSVMFKAVCNLILGRSSVFFQWNPDTRRFTQTLDNIPISGFSERCSQSFLGTLIDYSTISRQLSDFAASVQRQSDCTALVASKRCVRDVLDTVEVYLSKQSANTPSLLQLQQSIERPYALLGTLRDLQFALEGASSDEEGIISQLSDHVHSLVESGSPHSSLLRAVLTRVSAPWLERLAEDLGLSQGSGSSAQAMPISNGDKPSRLGMSVDSNAKAKEQFPAFIATEDSALISDTMSGLKLLRQHLPDSPVSDPVAYGIDSDFFYAFTPNVAVESIVERAKAFERAVSDAVNNHSNERTVLSSYTTDGDNNRPQVTEDAPCIGEEAQVNRMAELNAMMTTMPTTAEISIHDELRIATMSLLSVDQPLTNIKNMDLGSYFHVSPVERVRPFIQAQSRLVNGTLLRYLIRTCKLREHLDMQRAFHLLGNGSFGARLSTALFSPETQSARWQRGTVSTGETMGLRLDAREGQRWPPASSELRFTLTGILNEAYHGKTGMRASLPGGMSFAVRELSDAEIDKVMDVSSIHALDFLRLQYVAPAPLDAILTPACMQKYDDIFRFLLRLLRVLHVTTSLVSRFTSRQALRHNAISSDEEVNAARQFALEAHLVSTILMSHSMDVCIAAPWRQMSESLTSIGAALAAEDAYSEIGTRTRIGIEGLKRIHVTCLDSIRGRLFFRRKDGNVKCAIEDLLSAILEGAAASDVHEQSAQISASSAADTRMDSARSHLLRVLRDFTERCPKSTDTTLAGDNEVDIAKLLLDRLSWDHSMATG